MLLRTAVFALAVVTQSLSVIRNDHDQTTVIQVESFQALEQATDQAVDISDLRVVRIAVARSERFGSLVGRMRVT